MLMIWHHNNGVVSDAAVYENTALYLPRYSADFYENGEPEELKALWS